MCIFVTGEMAGVPQLSPSSRRRENSQVSPHSSCGGKGKGQGGRGVSIHSLRDHENDSSYCSTSHHSIGEVVRINLLTDHSSEYRTSSVLRKQQLSHEYQSLRKNVEKSYQGYRCQKRSSDRILTGRYLQWTSWFKKRYSTDPTTKLTKREFEKLWTFFNQLSSSSASSKSDQRSSSSRSSSSPLSPSTSSSPSSNGIHLDVIVEAFVEYGVFDTRGEALKLLKTIDTDRNQTITFLEFMDGINTSNLSQTLQLRYFISSLVSCRRKDSSIQEGKKNILGAFSNAVLRTRLRRVSTSSKLKSEEWDDLQQEDGDGDGVGSLDEVKEMVIPSPRKSTPSGDGIVSDSIESTAHRSSPRQYSKSRPHPLASRLRAISSRMSDSNRVYVQDS